MHNSSELLDICQSIINLRTDNATTQEVIVALQEMQEKLNNIVVADGNVKLEAAIQKAKKHIAEAELEFSKVQKGS